MGRHHHPDLRDLEQRHRRSAKSGPSAVPLSLDGTTPAVFVVASFPADDQDEVDQLVRVLILAGLAVRRPHQRRRVEHRRPVLRPVRELSATARQITEDDLSARLPVQGHDELADLGTTFNDMVDRFERGFAQQRRFLDDAAHELRTPITIARGHLEILGDDPVERPRPLPSSPTSSIG